MIKERFSETVSTGIVTDNITGKEYNCDVRIDEELLELLNALHEENQTLKAQLFCDIEEGVCSICNHQYLIKKGKYYVAKCEKEHSECSKVSLKYCEDFELVRDYDD